MSRNDSYLSLCLEQAALSSLHYRHGCIIVRGGKVIGKGYNDYRSGFNGGAQSTGNGPKLKNQQHYRQQLSEKKKMSSAAYVAFQSHSHPVGTGGGVLANTPLSMHSEMMAINSALSLSSAIAFVLNDGLAYSISKYTPTPFIKSPRSRPPRWIAVPGPTFNRLVLDPPYPNNVQHEQVDYYNKEEEEEGQKKNKTKKVSKRNNPGNNNVHHHAQINYLEFQKANAQKALRQLPSDDDEKHRQQYLYGIPHASQYHYSHHHSRHRKEQASIQQQQLQQRHRSSAVIVPQCKVVPKSHQVAERMKDSRLNGADLYVARLGKAGKSNHYGCGCQYDKPPPTDNKPAPALDIESGQPNKHPATKPFTGSLHDELRFPSPSQKSKPTTQPKQEHLTATHSRPCYRCISYMHSAGIKRVFWTNSRGEWEGGKVQTLVDALEAPSIGGSMSGVGDVGGAGNVTVLATSSMSNPATTAIVVSSRENTTRFTRVTSKRLSQPSESSPLSKTASLTSSALKNEPPALTSHPYHASDKTLPAFHRQFTYISTLKHEILSSPHSAKVDQSIRHRHSSPSTDLARQLPPETLRDPSAATAVASSLSAGPISDSPQTV
ncbi:MAG: hypothetical protein Q9218_007392 [Villophora microphyllina]